MILLADRNLVQGLLLDIYSMVHHVDEFKREKRLLKSEARYFTDRLRIMRVELTVVAPKAIRFGQMRDEFDIFRLAVMEIVARNELGVTN